MPELKCTVQTCTHNQNNYCCLDRIVVGSIRLQQHRLQGKRLHVQQRM